MNRKYIGEVDINNNPIFESYILRDTTSNFNTDIEVHYDEISQGFIDQFKTEYIWETLQKGKFEIVGMIGNSGVKHYGITILNPNEILLSKDGE